MILLDTHIWIWWVHGDARLDGRLAKRLEHEESRGLGISSFRVGRWPSWLSMGVLSCLTPFQNGLSKP